jgi:hypothetical protein
MNSKESFLCTSVKEARVVITQLQSFLKTQKIDHQ